MGSFQTKIRTTLGRLLPGCVLLLVLAGSVRAAHWEGFEGPVPSWQLFGGEKPYRVESHARVQEHAHAGAWSEMIGVTLASSAPFHATRTIEPLAVIEESSIRVWARSNRPGEQLLARVVLPRSIDPATGHPASLLVYGTAYQDTDSWQQLVIDGLPQRVERQARIAQSGQHDVPAERRIQYDTREAYVDEIRLTVVGGPGTTKVWIDDLEITGHVYTQTKTARVEPKGAAPIRTMPTASWSQPNTSPAMGHPNPSQSVAQVSWDSQVLSSGGRPLLPRIIEHRGEPFAKLKSLGFNAVALQQTATPAQLQEAAAAGLWLVCPPPVDAGDYGEHFRNILCWDVGHNLSQRDLQATATRVVDVRRADGPARRPICAQVTTDARTYSRHVDTLLLRRDVLGSSLEMSDYFTWLQKSSQLARPGTAIWATVPSEPSQALLRQVTSLTQQPLTAPLESGQLRTLVLGSIAHGVRGLYFASNTRLDGEDPFTRQRAAMLELLNQELSIIEPWAAAGRFVTSVKSNDPQVTAQVLQSDHARLVLPLRVGSSAQLVSPASTSKRLTFVVPGVPASSDAFELSPGGMRPLRRHRVTGGVSVSLDTGSTSSMILLTSDPLVKRKIMGRVHHMGKRAAELAQAVAMAHLGETEKILGALAVKPGETTTARGMLGRAQAAAAKNDHHNAVLLSGASIEATQAVRRRVWEQTISGFGSPHLLATGTSFSTLLQHRAVTSILRGSLRGVNQIPTGDCEDLQAMVSAGWQHVQLPQRDVQAHVALSEIAPRTNRRSLHLSVRPKDMASPPAWIESPPLWVTTPPVPLAGGQMVEVHGYVRVSQAIKGSVDSLMVIDSLGGDALALRFGPAGEWQEFTFYRKATESGNFTVTFALTGLGEAWVDGLTVNPITMPPPAQPAQPRATTAFGLQPGSLR